MTRYEVVVTVVEYTDGTETNTVGRWPIGPWFGESDLADAITHGQRVRKAGDRIPPPKLRTPRL